jgi:hypothetical protein
VVVRSKAGRILWGWMGRLAVGGWQEGREESRQSIVDGRRATVRAGGRRGAHAWRNHERALRRRRATGVWWRQRDAGARRNERVNGQGFSDSRRW